MIHPAPMRRRSKGPLWAITTYFNPCGYRRRLENYHTFRRQLAVPLVTVELSFDGVFELEPADSDILVQLSGADVMWQKERLLNVALGSLPKECTKVAWLDCDVVFDNADWPEAAALALDRHAVIQPFSQSRELVPDVGVDRCDREHSQPKGEALASALATSRLKEDVQRSAVGNPSHDECGSRSRLASGYLLSTAVGDRPDVECGMAWAARTEIIHRHNFYDACIMGCGDGAIIAGILGNFQDLIDYLLMNGRRAEHYLNWAKPFHETIRGDLGFCAGTIYHLWHGERKDRQYLRRRVEFAEFDFDPFHDISFDKTGCWRWNTDKPQMHRFVKDYFPSRLEDGRSESAPREVVVR